MAPLTTDSTTRTFAVGDLRRAAEAGIRAPSLLNSQPWLFRLHDGAIEIRIDPGRRLDAADRSGWAAGGWTQSTMSLSAYTWVRPPTAAPAAM
jgi:nitroreductase